MCIRDRYGIEEVGSKPYLLKRLIKSLLGLPLNIIYSIKAYGVKRGIKRGLNRWRTKVLYRWYLLFGGAPYE